MDLVVIDELLFIVPTLWCIGCWLKNTPNIKDWCIPYILSVFSIIGAICVCGLTVQAVANGVVAVGIAVFGNQIYKQTFNKSE